MFFRWCHYLSRQSNLRMLSPDRPHHSQPCTRRLRHRGHDEQDLSGAWTRRGNSQWRSEYDLLAASCHFYASELLEEGHLSRGSRMLLESLLSPVGPSASPRFGVDLKITRNGTHWNIFLFDTVSLKKYHFFVINYIFYNKKIPLVTSAFFMATSIIPIEGIFYY